MPAHFLVYTSPNCAWCDRTKALLTREGHSFEIKDVTGNPSARQFLMNMGLRTVPQTFLVGGGPEEPLAHIGGHEALVDWLKANDGQN